MMKKWHLIGIIKRIVNMKRWDTVMSFLKSLQEMGVLEYKRCGYNMKVRIINLTYFPIEKKSK